MSLGDGVCSTGNQVQVGSDPPVFADECTLRAALGESNAFAGFDTITFSGVLPKISQTVQFLVAAPLPALQDPVLIDGYSHPDYDPAASFPQPVIQLLGSAPPAGTNGLLFSPGAEGSTLRGVAITDFTASGVAIVGFDAVAPANIAIEGSQFGVNRGVFYTGNDLDGITIVDSQQITIGATCSATTGCSGRGNVLSANGRSGIRIDGGSSVRIAGNFIGTDRSGSTTSPPFSGPSRNVEYGVHLLSNASSNEVGSLGGVFDAGSGQTTPVASGNVISGNLLGGVRIEGVFHSVHANHIGTNAAGDAALPNQGPGLHVRADAITVGSIGVGSNLVSGNTGIGIWIENAAGTADDAVVTGNRIGVDAAGAGPLGNTLTGLAIEGDDVVVRSNVIGANGAAGILDSGQRTEIQENWIGTNAAGADLGNVGAGVEVASIAAQIGGSGLGNTIGWNDVGIDLTLAASSTVVEGNFVGANAGGDDLGNSADGVLVEGVAARIGARDGRANGLANTIGFNGGAGIVLQGPASNVVVAGNFVGTDAVEQDLGNMGEGVLVTSTSQNHRIGAPIVTPAAIDVVQDGNAVAWNGAGIVVVDAIEVPLRGNLLRGNDGPGIDLGGDGVTPNDFGDGDSGPNRLQNAPEFDPALTFYNDVTGEVTVRYVVEADPVNGAYPLTIDFYLSEAWLAPGEEVGAYLGTDSFPQSSAFSFRQTTILPIPGSFPLNPFGDYFGVLRATATDGEGNTSELSASFVSVPEPGIPPMVLAGVFWTVSRVRRRRPVPGKRPTY